MHNPLARTRPSLDPETAPVWGAVIIRLATAADRTALERLAQLDSAPRPHEPVLIGELRGRAVAAISLADGAAIADPFVASGELVELLRLRAGQLRRGSRAHPPLRMLEATAA